MRDWGLDEGRWRRGVSSAALCSAIWAASVGGLAMGPAAAHAQEGADASQGSAPSIGPSPWALPGLHRIGAAVPGQRSLSVAGDLGYGLTEAQTADDGRHHRLFGSVAVGVSPLPWLGLALRLDGRYDRHPEDALGTDDGWVGTPSLALRAGHELGSGWALGADVAVAFPGGDAPSFEPSAITTDLAALLTWSGKDLPLSVLARVGYRFDRSARSVDRADQLRQGDRIALGVSEFDAVLVGLGLLYRPGAAELFAEATADLLIGSGAPGAGKSPIRATIGARYAVTEALRLAATVETVVSGRPALDPLAPIEPRVTASLGLRYTWGLDRSEPTPAPDSQQPIEPESKEEKAEPEANPEETADEPAVTEEAPAEPPPPTELRGVIRSFEGEPVKARIRVEPGDSTAQTDADGHFEIELPPGQYTVHIEASGYRPQSRAVSVDERGVTVLNVELRKSRRGR
jgi:hypothetical protein